jgi:hypothetical protein
MLKLENCWASTHICNVSQPTKWLKTANPNKSSLRGFNVVDDLKASQGREGMARSGVLC